jgi:predicted acetyltransferase
MADFRPIPDAHRERHFEIKSQAFRPTERSADFDDDAPLPVPDQRADHRGLYAADDLVAVASICDLRARVRDEWHATAGVRAVATPPEHRGRGYARELLEASMAECYENSVRYSVLWPFAHEFYRDLGWGLVHTETTYEFEPGAVAGIATEQRGHFELVDPETPAPIEPVYETFAERYALAIQRSRDWWRDRVLDEAWTYCWYPPDQETPAGYLVYEVENEGDEQVMCVDEFVAPSDRAREQLWGFVGRHAAQIDRVRVTLPEETRLFQEVADPNAVDCTVEPRAMFRLVDVEAALDDLSVERTAGASITVRVRDPLVDANDATFEIAPTSTGIECTRRAADSEPDLELAVSTLSKLFLGSVSPDAIAEREELSTVQKRTFAALAGERQAYVTDFF